MASGLQVESPDRGLELVLGDLWEGLQKLAFACCQKQLSINLKLSINLNSSCLEGRKTS